MKTDKLLQLIQQKKVMRSGGALPLPKAKTGIAGPCPPGLVKNAKGECVLQVTDPNDPRLRSYRDSADLYDLSKKVSKIYPNLKEISKKKYDEINEKDNKLPYYDIDRVEYNEDKKKGVNKPLSSYIYSREKGNHDDPIYLKNYQKELSKYSDNVEDFAIILPNGDTKMPGGIYNGKPDWSDYNIVSPNGTSRHYVTDYDTGKKELLHINAYDIKPIKTHYYGSDVPIPFGNITESSTGWYKGQKPPDLKKLKDYKNYTYLSDFRDEYKEPVIKVELVKTSPLDKNKEIKREEIQPITRKFDFSIDEDLKPIAPTPYVPDPVRRVMNPAFNFNVDFLPNRTKEAVVDELGNPRYKYYNGDKVITEKEYNELMQKRQGGSLHKYEPGGEDNIIGVRGPNDNIKLPVDPYSGLPLINLKGVEIVGEKDYGSYIDQLRKDWANTYNEHPIMNVIPGGNALLTLGNFLSTPQKSLMYGFTGRYDTPSNINPTKGLGNFQNKAVDVMQDIAFDPLNFAGALPELFNRGRNIFKGGKNLFNTGKNFKSEINWGKWNSEIPTNKALMDEYHAIEKTSKANGTWMKNPDGSVFQGTPEQFVQQNSKNFKKAFPEGFTTGYRGAHQHIDDFANRDLNAHTATFLTDSKANAETYATSDGLPKTYYHPEVDVHPAYDPKLKGHPLNHEDGIYQLAFPKNLPKVVGEGRGNNWRFLDYDENIANNINPEHLKNDHEFRVSTFNSPKKNSSINTTYPNDFTVDKKYLTTDNYATYVKNNPIGIAEIKNVSDQMGNVPGISPNTIYAIDANKVPIKSLMYNNGMFDMTNPNIYKGLVPAGIFGAGIFGAGMYGTQGIQQQRDGGWRGHYAKGGSLPKAQKGLPNDYEQFLEYSKTAPENRRPDANWKYGDPRNYDHYGMWDALGKPKNWEEALRNNPEWERDEYDGSYHGFSTNPNTGVWLKSHIPGEYEPGNTSWMENLAFQLSGDPNYNPHNFSLVFDPELQRMRYIPKEKEGGSLPKAQAGVKPFITSDINEYNRRQQLYNDSAYAHNVGLANWKNAQLNLKQNVDKFNAQLPSAFGNIIGPSVQLDKPYFANSYYSPVPIRGIWPTKAAHQYTVPQPNVATMQYLNLYHNPSFYEPLTGNALRLYNQNHGTGYNFAYDEADKYHASVNLYDAPKQKVIFDKNAPKNKITKTVKSLHSFPVPPPKSIKKEEIEPITRKFDFSVDEELKMPNKVELTPPITETTNTPPATYNYPEGWFETYGKRRKPKYYKHKQKEGQGWLHRGACVGDDCFKFAEGGSLPKAQYEGNINVRESTAVNIPKIKDPVIKNVYDSDLLDADYAVSVANKLLKDYNVKVDSTGNILKDVGLPSSAYYNPITRTINYNSNADNSEYAKRKYFKRVVAEIPHAIQADRMGTIPFLVNIGIDALSNPSISRYRQKGTLENEAHRIMQPQLEEKIDEAALNYPIARKQGGSLPKHQLVGPVSAQLINQALGQNQTKVDANNIRNYAQEQKVAANTKKVTPRNDATIAPKGSVRSYVQKAADYMSHAGDPKVDEQGNVTYAGTPLDPLMKYVGAPILQSGVNLANTIMGDRPLNFTSSGDIEGLAWDAVNLLPFTDVTASVGKKFITAFDDAGRMAFGISPKMGAVPKSTANTVRQTSSYVVPDPVEFYPKGINIKKLIEKSRKPKPSVDAEPLTGSLVLEKNPSRVENIDEYLGTRRDLKRVVDPKTNESISLKSWRDENGNIRYYFSSQMPYSSYNAGKSYYALDKFIPKNSIIVEPPGGSLSFDSFINTVKRTKNSKFKSSLLEGSEGIRLNNQSVKNKLPFSGDLGDGYYTSLDEAQKVADEINGFIKDYNLPKATVTQHPYDGSYQIMLPHISLEKLYKKGGELTSQKAAEILHDGTANGKPLTDKQKRYFGYIANKNKRNG